jgi:hypothetical protein
LISGRRRGPRKRIRRRSVFRALFKNLSRPFDYFLEDATKAYQRLGAIV